MAKIDLNISVLKSKVYAEVLKVTGYAGLKDKQDLSTFDTIAYNEGQSEMLDRWWLMCTNAVTDILRPYITQTPTIDTSYAVKCSMPSNWNQYVAADINDTILNFFVNYICSQWMRIVKDQDSQQSATENKYATDAVSSLSEIKRKIYDRVRPKKPVYTTDEDSTDEDTSDSSDSDRSSSSNVTEAVPNGSGIANEIAGNSGSVSQGQVVL